MAFRDRTDAGKQLARRVLRAQPPAPIVVLGLPRGGIPVAAPIAAALKAPLEAFIACKVGAPGHAELGIGAVAEGSEEIVESAAAAQLGIGSEQLQSLAARPARSCAGGSRSIARGRELPPLAGRTVILVDDGLATGVTAEAALHSLLRHDPQRLILAVPVCAADTRDRLRHLVDELICLQVPDNFYAVGQWYDRFEQTTDGEVLELLAASES